MTMQIVQPTAQLFLREHAFATEAALAVFHRWIQEDRFAELVPIDVVDYSHIVDGPIVLLVTDAAYVGLVREAGRIGLAFRRRRGTPEPVGLAVAGALRWVLRAAIALEETLAAPVASAPNHTLLFAPTEFCVGCDDRLRAPNTPASFLAAQPQLEALGRRLYDTPELTATGDAKTGLRATIRGTATSLQALLLRLDA
ncbi:MAG: hypothetical protein EXR75_09065 [Myxococcales bacterium]|nr:hypothetical protein [Myxococcales bacterium]